MPSGSLGVSEGFLFRYALYPGLASLTKPGSALGAHGLGARVAATRIFQPNTEGCPQVDHLAFERRHTSD